MLNSNRKEVFTKWGKIIWITYGDAVLRYHIRRFKRLFYDGVYIYKGIPYAYADRFQMPVPSKWDGVKDATNYGFVCPLQNQDTPNGELMVPHRYWPQDVHCQSLNIWTNKLDPEAKKHGSRMVPRRWIRSGIFHRAGCV